MRDLLLSHFLLATVFSNLLLQLLRCKSHLALLLSLKLQLNKLAVGVIVKMVDKSVAQLLSLLLELILGGNLRPVYGIHDWHRHRNRLKHVWPIELMIQL